MKGAYQLTIGIIYIILPPRQFPMKGQVLIDDQPLSHFTCALFLLNVTQCDETLLNLT